MSSNNNNGIDIREKLSAEEAAKLVQLLSVEVPISKYAKVINERTGEEININDAIQQRQPKPSSCFEYFTDYMNCHVRLFLYIYTHYIISHAIDYYFVFIYNITLYLNFVDSHDILHSLLFDSLALPACAGT